MYKKIIKLNNENNMNSKRALSTKANFIEMTLRRIRQFTRIQTEKCLKFKVLHR